MAKVYIRFPNTGLGNMMLVWARGVIFANLNNLNYTTSSWWGLRWGALLRREKKKRFYMGYFNETPFLKQWAMKIYCKIVDAEKDPPVDKVLGKGKDEKKIYIFSKALTGNDIFSGLRDHHEIITAELNRVLAPQMKRKLPGYKVPIIGVHIRRGDFKIGNQTTPLEYFIEGINLIRKILNEAVPVTVFTDATAKELRELLLLSNINIAEDKPDILDIILLSKSKVLILSKSSTFSYWAAFLSEATVIRPFDDWQPLIKNDSSNYQEIKWNFRDKGSTHNLEKKLKQVNHLSFKSKIV